MTKDFKANQPSGLLIPIETDEDSINQELTMELCKFRDRVQKRIEVIEDKEKLIRETRELIDSSIDKYLLQKPSQTESPSSLGSKNQSQIFQANNEFQSDTEKFLTSLFTCNDHRASNSTIPIPLRNESDYDSLSFEPRKKPGQLDTIEEEGVHEILEISPLPSAREILLTGIPETTSLARTEDDLPQVDNSAQKLNLIGLTLPFIGSNLCLPAYLIDRQDHTRTIVVGASSSLGYLLGNAINYRMQNLSGKLNLMACFSSSLIVGAVSAGFCLSENNEDQKELIAKQVAINIGCSLFMNFLFLGLNKLSTNCKKVDSSTTEEKSIAIKVDLVESERSPPKTSSARFSCLKFGSSANSRVIN